MENYIKYCRGIAKAYNEKVAQWLGFYLCNNAVRKLFLILPAQAFYAWATRQHLVTYLKPLSSGASFHYLHEIKYDSATQNFQGY